MADETQSKVSSLVADIVKKRVVNEAPPEDTVEPNADTENTNIDKTITAIRGKPKSGRFWKSQKEK